MPFPGDNGGGNYPTDQPLLRLGGLWRSKSGKAIMGNVYVADPRRTRDQTAANVPFGDILIDMIKQCMDENKPLRFLVFETDRGGAPFNLNVTIGQASEKKPDQAAFGAGNTGKASAPWGPTPVELPEDQDGEAETDPEPAPRPIRRSAPRR